jgi:peptidoglycan/LPS O-acetylase OafA/YrhL
VQTLRGVACMLLVAYHVIGNDNGMGLRVPSDSGYRAFADMLLHLRMPLFTFLSGFVYAYRPVRAGTEWTFARKKLWRLGAPFVVVSALYFVVQGLAPGTNREQQWGDFWKIFFTTYAHFWFLQASIVIFALAIVVEKFRLMQTLSRYVWVLAGAFAIHFLFVPHTDFFSINQAGYLLPFFIAGVGANRYRDSFRNLPLQTISLVAFAVTWTLHLLACYGVYGEIQERRELLATILSMSGVLVMLYWTPPNRMLAWVGGFSFSIYLYHVFFTAGLRTAIHGVGIHDLAVHVVLGCAAGIIGPIIVEWVLKRNRFTRQAFLGQS